MNTTLRVTVALVSGIAIGALGIESLRAQSKPAGLLVAEFEVTDPSGWKLYREGARAMPSNGGVFLARAAKSVGLLGRSRKRSRSFSFRLWTTPSLSTHLLHTLH